MPFFASLGSTLTSGSFLVSQNIAKDQVRQIDVKHLYLAPFNENTHNGESIDIPVNPISTGGPPM